MPIIDFAGLVFAEVVMNLSRLVTGRLLTEDQLLTMSQNAVGRYLASWLAMPADEAGQIHRVEQAQEHISEASRIISELHADLDEQVHQLDRLKTQVAEQETLAAHYANLAAVNQAASAAVRAELEAVVRAELRAESERGKRIRQIFSFAAWLITLVVGAAVGAYWIEIEGFVRGLWGL